MILQVFDRVYRDVMGVPPLYEYARGITDANIFSRRLQFLLEEDIASNDNI